MNHNLIHLKLGHLIPAYSSNIIEPQMVSGRAGCCQDRRFVWRLALAGTKGAR